jgi:hypothetical protein
VLFERICRENGITQRLTKPRSPTTTGKIERLHQTLQQELLNVHGPFASIEDAQVAVDTCRKQYNAERPHSHWRWRIPLPGSPAPPVTGSACGYPPNWPGPHRLPCLMLIPRRMIRRLPVRRETLTAIARQAGRWSWTGWSRRRGTCGWQGSRSGWDRP